MPRRPQDPNHSCDINIPTTMPGTPITIDASENVRLKVLENRMVPKNTSHLDKPDEFDDFKENDYLYVSNDDGELRKFPIRSITAEKALDYTEAYSLVVEDASQSLIGQSIDQLEACKFNRLPIRNAETFHLYIYLTEEVNGNRTTTGAFVCTAETIGIEEPVYDPTAHITAVITSAISLGDDFESITINEHKAPIINGNIPISIRFNGTEFATTVLNNKLATELTATINGQEIPIDNQSIAKTVVRINGDDVPMDPTKPGVIDLDIDTRINNARQAEEDRATEAEDAIANDLDEERRVRIENDDILQSNITKEEARAKAAEETNANNIKAEETRAKNRESQLDTDIKNTGKNLISVQEALVSNINSEMAARIKGDSDLTQIINTEKNTRSSEDNRVLAESKAYTTSEINKLDFDKTGGEGSYIRSIEEIDGKIFAESDDFIQATELEGKVYLENTSDNKLVSSSAVKKYVDYLYGKNEEAWADAIVKIDRVDSVVPLAATPGGKDKEGKVIPKNELADKDFVNSSIATNTATYRGNFNSYSDLGIAQTGEMTDEFKALIIAALNNITGENLIIGKADNNDYVFVGVPEVLSETSRVVDYYRFKYVEKIDSQTGKAEAGASWNFEYKLNSTGFTSEQWAAINSKATETITNNAIADHNLLTAGTAGQIIKKVNVAAEGETPKLENQWVSLDFSGNGLTGSYIKNVIEKDGVVSTETQQFDAQITDTTGATNDNAPGTAAVKNYVEDKIADLTTSDQQVPAGQYISKITESGGIISVTTASLVTDVSTDAQIAPTTQAVKNYVDTETTRAEAKETELAAQLETASNTINTRIDNLNANFDIPDNKYITSISEESGLIKVSTANIDDLPTAGSNKLVSSQGVLTEIEKDGFIVIDNFADLANYAKAVYNGYYIKYNGPTTVDSENKTVLNGTVYKVSAVQDTQAITTNSTTTTIPFTTVNVYKVLDLVSDNFTSLSAGSHSSTGTNNSITKNSVSTDAGNGHYTTANDISTVARWSGTGSKSSTVYTYENRGSAATYTYSTNKGILIGIGLNGQTAQTKDSWYNDTVKVGGTTTSLTSDSIRNIAYTSHSLQFNSGVSDATLKYSIDTMIEQNCNGLTDDVNSAHGIYSTVWLAYKQTSESAVTYIKIYERELKFNSIANGWLNDRYEDEEQIYNLKDILAQIAEVDGKKTIELVCAIGGYKAAAGSTSWGTDKNVFYLWGYSEVSGIKLAVHDYSNLPAPSIKRWFALEDTTASKDYVASAINSVSAYYITSDVDKHAFATKSALENASAYYYDGAIRVPTRNDYAIVLADESNNNSTVRYVYGDSDWSMQYIVSQKTFSETELAAISSGITGQLVKQIPTTTYLESATKKENGDLALTIKTVNVETATTETFTYSGGAINTISVNGGEKQKPDGDKNVDLSVNIPIKTISVGETELEPDEDGNIDLNTAIGDKLGNVISVTEATREVEVYTEFID